MRIIVVSLILILLISGCINPSNPMPATPITSSPQATETLAPTLDGMSSPLPTVFVMSSPIPATLDLSDLTSVAEATQKPLFEKHCNDFLYRYFFNSHWGVCDTDDKAFIVFGVDGRVWQFSYVELGVALADEGSEFYTQAVYWSDDEKFAYFAPFPRDYDPLGPFYGDGIALLKVNLTNGQIQIILPNTYDFYSISFSPTGKYMAYAEFNSDKPLDLIIQDLQSGELKHEEQEAKYDQVGEFVWSSDGLQLAYKLIINGDECARTFAIRLLDVNNMISNSVIDNTQVDTCQPLDLTYYISEVNDKSLILEQHGDTWVYSNDTKQLLLTTTATPKP